MTTPAKAVVLIVRSEDGTVEICDANGNKRKCDTVASYAEAIHTILEDPSLPQIEDVPPERAQVEDAVVQGVKEAVPPFLRPFVRPGFQKLGGLLQAFSVKTQNVGYRRGSRRRTSRPTTGRAA